MKKSAQFICTVLLINLCYGFINLFLLGSFLTLIPLEPLLAAIIFFIGWYFSVPKNQFITYISLLFIVLKLTQTELLYESITIDDFQKFYHHFLIDILKIGELIVFTLIIIYFLKLKTKFNVFILLIFIALIWLSSYFSNFWFNPRTTETLFGCYVGVIILLKSNGKLNLSNINYEITYSLIGYAGLIIINQLSVYINL